MLRFLPQITEEEITTEKSSKNSCSVAIKNTCDWVHSQAKNSTARK